MATMASKYSELTAGIDQTRSSATARFNQDIATNASNALATFTNTDIAGLLANFKKNIAD